MKIKKINSSILYAFLFLATFSAVLSCNQTTLFSKDVQNSKTISPPKTISPESPEAKAIRIAEEFIISNGYTNAPADKNSISHESVEMAESLDQLLKLRHDTLERKAYGLRYKSEMDKQGWTIVFRERAIYEPQKYDEQWGRAVYLNEKFEVIQIEHKSFPLANIEKKL